MTTYPLTFPASLKVSSVVPTLKFMSAVTRSPFTGERQAFRWDGEMWSFEYTTPPCTVDVAEEWIAFANKLQGKFGTFLIGDFSRTASRGVGGGSPVVDGASQTGYALNVRGCPATLFPWLKKGDYFQVGTGSTARLHKLIEDINTDSGGRATLEFVPKLRYSPADGAAIVISNCVGVFSLSDAGVTWSVDNDGYYHYTFRAEEAL